MSIYISSGHNPLGAKVDPGAVSSCMGGVKEADLTVIMKNLIVKELDKLGVKYITDKDTETLGQYLARIKPGEGSVLLELHFNAGPPTATGVETIVANNASKNSLDFAKTINDITVVTLGLRDRGVKRESQSARGRLAFVQGVGIRALVELAFISNCEDVRKWNENKEQLAIAYAKILQQYDDLIK